MLYTVLLAIHIAAGSLALLTAAGALLTQKGGVRHVRAGRVYAISMTLVFLTAVPLALMGADIFLLLIAVFSLLSGVRGLALRSELSRQGARG